MDFSNSVQGWFKEKEKPIIAIGLYLLAAVFGSGGEARTRDQLVNSQLLYH